MISDTSPPRRGEFRERNILRHRGGLLNKEQNDEVCDATEVHPC